MDEERRYSKRLEIFLMVDIKSAGQTINYFLGMTKNLSVDGFSFESQNYEIKPGARLEFELKDPDGDLYVHAVGKIIWKKASDFECLLGVQFQGLDKESRKALSDLLAKSESVKEIVPVTEKDTVNDSGTVEKEIEVGQEEEAVEGSLNQTGPGECVNEDNKSEIVDVRTIPAKETIFTDEVDNYQEGALESEQIEVETPIQPPQKTSERVSRRSVRKKSQDSVWSRWYVKAVLIAAVIIAIPAQSLFHDMKLMVSGPEPPLEDDQPQQVLSELELLGPAPVEEMGLDESEIIPDFSKSYAEVEIEENIAALVPPVTPPEPQRDDIPEADISLTEGSDLITTAAKLEQPVLAEDTIKDVAVDVNNYTPLDAEEIVQPDEDDIKKPEEIQVSNELPQEKPPVKPTPKQKAVQALAESLQAIPKSVSPPIVETIAGAGLVAAVTETAETELPQVSAPEETPVLTDTELPTVQEDEDVAIQEIIPEKESDELFENNIMLVVKKSEEKEATISPVPEVAEDQFTVYEDDFNDNVNNWDTFSTKAASARIDWGEYYLENKRESGAHLVFHYYNFSHENDYIIEASVRTVQAMGRYSYGFIFGAKNAFSNYIFLVNGDNLFTVVRNDNGRREKLAGGSIGNMNTDLANTIRIVKEGDITEFFINGTSLAKIPGLSYVGARIGFILDGKSEIAIDKTYARIKKGKEPLQ